jgi:hypothetical protein
MQTKIFHPNVSKAGEICVDTLKKGWKKEYGVGHVLVVRHYLLVLQLAIGACCTLMLDWSRQAGSQMEGRV